MEGARHIVQELWIPPIRPSRQEESGPGERSNFTQNILTGQGREDFWMRAAPGSDRKIRAVNANRENVNHANNVIIYERMPNGTLEWVAGQMWKLNMHPLPDRMLWHIFLCLIRGCIALKFPGAFRSKLREMGGHATPFAMPLSDEIYPKDIDKGPRQPGPLVHLDIDPSNVFIGARSNSNGRGEHGLFPIVKIGDLGCGTQVADQKLKDYHFLLSYRKVGKSDYLAPEQFAREWDYIGRIEDLPQGGWNVAGNYGHATNLWGVGLVSLVAVGRMSTKPLFRFLIIHIPCFTLSQFKVPCYTVVVIDY
jgi:serine/threonine protein kinase